MTPVYNVIGFNNTEYKVTEGNTWLCTRTGIEALLRSVTTQVRVSRKILDSLTHQ